MADWKWKAGDLLMLPPGDTVDPGTGERFNPVYREIIEARPGSGYTWRYPDAPDLTFISENSNDPQMLWGWQKVEKDT